MASASNKRQAGGLGNTSLFAPNVGDVPDLSFDHGGSANPTPARQRGEPPWPNMKIPVFVPVLARAADRDFPVRQIECSVIGALKGGAAGSAAATKPDGETPEFFSIYPLAKNRKPCHYRRVSPNGRALRGAMRSGEGQGENSYGEEIGDYILGSLAQFRGRRSVDRRPSTIISTNGGKPCRQIIYYF